MGEPEDDGDFGDKVFIRVGSVGEATIGDDSLCPEDDSAVIALEVLALLPLPSLSPYTQGYVSLGQAAVPGSPR